MIEHEYKLMLDKDNFEKAIKYIKENYSTMSEKDNIQINYYYDTNNFDLHNNHTTCRIRQKEDSLKLEVKIKSLVGKNQISSEYEYDFYEVKKEIVSPEIIISKFNIQNLNLIGSLVTYRKHICLEDNLFIDIDTSFYMGKTDYEIEIEYTEKSEKNATNIFENLCNICTLIKGDGKYTRFLKTIIK